MGDLAEVTAVARHLRGLDIAAHAHRHDGVADLTIGHHGGRARTVATALRVLRDHGLGVTLASHTDRATVWRVATTPPARHLEAVQ
ncbi:MAG: hypothetical protein S0880_10390 [Actinomycetota bacterium]|nr:hypothetical protein [Actinomycetota bacterium]